jgi:hypothetical protein
MDIFDVVLLADINVPNNLSLEIKLMYMNEINKQLYREFPNIDQVSLFTTQPDVSTYAFPANINPIDGAHAVRIGDQPYTLCTQEEMDSSRRGRLYTITNLTPTASTITLKPTPTEELTVFIYYRKQVEDVSAGGGIDFGEEPTFPRDFHEALVFGISKRLAMTLSPPNLDLAAYYGNEMDRLVEFARKSLQKNYKNRVVVNRRWA